MTSLLYWFARGAVAVMQALPLKLVAWIGRAGGRIWWWVDFKHSKLVLQNLQHAFPDRTSRELRRIAREVFQRIAENGFAAVKTASMSVGQLARVCEVVGLEKIPPYAPGGSPSNCMSAIGHFGNFEIYTLIGSHADGWQGAATYRGMNQPGLDRIVQRMRERPECLFFERRTQARALKEALSKGGILLGLLSDQSPGKGGVTVPFFGRDCATTAAPAIFALRYDAPLFPIICYRTGLGRWRLEVGDEIPVREEGQPRSTAAIMTDVNREFEKAIRRDPANWFWVHNRWKQRKMRKQQPAPRPRDEEADPEGAPEPPSTSDELPE